MLRASFPTETRPLSKWLLGRVASYCMCASTSHVVRIPRSRQRGHWQEPEVHLAEYCLHYLTLCAMTCNAHPEATPASEDKMPKGISGVGVTAGAMTETQLSCSRSMFPTLLGAMAWQRRTIRLLGTVSLQPLTHACRLQCVEKMLPHPATNEGRVSLTQLPHPPRQVKASLTCAPVRIP